jgi:diguanylate cyclase (GGDEF)-like protein/PAS domain S-box-containing protein
MMERMKLSSPRQRFWRSFAARFIPCAVAILVAVGYNAYVDWNFTEQRVRMRAERSVALQTTGVRAELRAIRSDLALLASSEELHRFISNPVEIRKRSLERYFLTFSTWKPRYDQIRFIDLGGREVVRIDRFGDDPLAVPEEGLQDKSGRYYVREGLKLPSQRFLVSPLDLNIERGQIERPLKPMIRLVAPVFSEFGHRQGIVVLNYRANVLLAQLRSQGGEDAPPMLLNAAGHWLLSDHPEDEWGWLLPERRGRSFASRYPQAWATIQAEQQGLVRTSEAFFTFSTVTYARRPSSDPDAPFMAGAGDIGADGEAWKIVVRSPFRPMLVFRGMLPDAGAALLFLAMAAMLSQLMAVEALRREQATRDLAASEAAARERLVFQMALLESLPLPVYFKGLDGRYRGCNSAFARFVGRERQEVVGLSAADLAPPDLAARYAAADQTLLRTLKPQVDEQEAIRADGQRRQVMFTRSPFYAADGSPAGVIGAMVDLTAHKEAEAKLERTGEYLRHVLSAIPTPVFVKDRQHRFKMVNDAACAAWGLPRNRMLGRTADGLFPEAEARAFRERDENVFRTGRTDVNEERVTDRDGKQRTCLTKKVVCRNPEGEQVLVGIIVDITELKEAKAAAERAKVYLQRVLDTLPGPIFVKDAQHRWLFVNEAFCQAIGHTRERVLGKSDYDFFPKGQADVFWAKDRAVFASRKPNLNEERFTGSDGQERVCLTKKAVFQNIDGADVLVGAITDITERKKIEDTLRLMAEVFEHCAEGVFIADHDRRILRVNQAYEAITEFEAAEVVGKPSELCVLEHNDDVAPVDIWRCVVEMGRWQGEIACRRKGGEAFAAALTLSGVRDEAGCVRRYIGIFNDVSEQKQEEKRIRHLAQHDFLTGLANRNLLYDRIEHALLRANRDGTCLAVLLIDLDLFKQVNDTFGHAAGDRLLKHVAAQLKQALRQTDTISRIGGDEFVVLLPDLRGPADAFAVAETLQASLGSRFEIDGRPIHVGASIGASIFPTDGRDRAALLRAADDKMYRMKRKNAAKRALGEHTASLFRDVFEPVRAAGE